LRDILIVYVNIGAARRIYNCISVIVYDREAVQFRKSN